MALHCNIQPRSIGSGFSTVQMSNAPKQRTQRVWFNAVLYCSEIESQNGSDVYVICFRIGSRAPVHWMIWTAKAALNGLHNADCRDSSVRITER